MTQDMSTTRTDLWWLRLYNTQPNDVLYTMAYDRMRALTLSTNTIRTLEPQIMDALDQHWKAYKRFVDKWLDNTLTEKDWVHARMWVGRELLHCEFFPDMGRQVRPTSILLQLMKNNPNEPLTDAYKQVVSRIARERLGMPYIRPLLCSACRQLFEPRQHEQRWCSARCRNRIQKQRYRATMRSINGTTDSHILERERFSRPIPVGETQNV